MHGLRRLHRPVNRQPPSPTRLPSPPACPYPAPPRSMLDAGAAARLYRSFHKKAWEEYNSKKVRRAGTAPLACLLSC